MLKPRGVYYIAHIENLSSILERGILCHRRIEEDNIHFTPIYDAEIVKKRKEIPVSESKTLWDFANLYLQPRNAMLYRVAFFSGKNIEDIVILGLKSSILERKDIFITTGNAASPNTEILSGSQAKKRMKTLRKEIEKEWWTSEDGSKRTLMAECLVPDSVSPEYIQEIYVASHKAISDVKAEIGSLKIPIIPEPSLFFIPSRRIELTQNLSISDGDLFFSRMQTLTVSVNTVGVMGGGLASRAKYQFPDLYVVYQDLCKNKVLKMGRPYLYKREKSLDYTLADEAEVLPDVNLQTWLLLFPTKNHWKEMADIKGVEEGLGWLVENYKKEGISSLAIPALGCGFGWLDWGMVGPILCRYLKRLEIPVSIYLPAEKKVPDDQLSKEFLLEE